jgi:hypothetical protein
MNLFLCTRQARTAHGHFVAHCLSRLSHPPVRAQPSTQPSSQGRRGGGNKRLERRAESRTAHTSSGGSSIRWDLARSPTLDRRLLAMPTSRLHYLAVSGNLGTAMQRECLTPDTLVGLMDSQTASGTSTLEAGHK